MMRHGDHNLDVTHSMDVACLKGALYSNITHLMCLNSIYCPALYARHSKLHNGLVLGKGAWLK